MHVRRVQLRASLEVIMNSVFGEPREYESSAQRGTAKLLTWWKERRKMYAIGIRADDTRVCSKLNRRSWDERDGHAPEHKIV